MGLGVGDNTTTVKVCVELICNFRIGQTQRGTSKVACLWIWLFPIAFLVCLKSDNPFNFSILARISAPGTLFWSGGLGLVEKPSPSNGLLEILHIRSSLVIWLLPKRLKLQTWTLQLYFEFLLSTRQSQAVGSF